MNVQELNERTAEIKRLVNESYVDPSGKAKPIYDGVVNPEHYVNAKYKLLWILKEPWDGDDGSGGNWSVTDFMAGLKHIGRDPTWQPIIYVTYAVLNGFKKRAEMQFIRDNPNMGGILKDVAYINVKKLPGGRRANNATILKFYQSCKSIILKQIEACAPDIVIGCRPHMYHIMRDVGFSDSDIKPFGSTHYASNGSRCFVDAYHPAQSRISREKYVDDIVELTHKVLVEQKI